MDGKVVYSLKNFTKLKMDQKNEISTIERLPNEILLKIFSYISGHHLSLSVSKVCRYWKHLVSHITLKLMRPEDKAKIHGGVMVLLINTHIPSLPEPRALVFEIATLIPHLKELSISEIYNFDKHDLKIIEKLHNLRHLDIFTSCFGPLDESTPISYNIKTLVVNNDIAEGFLRKMENPNRVIKAFHMYGSSRYYPINEMESFLSLHSKTLTELTLRCSDLKDRSYKVISLCEELTSLQLYKCSQLTSHAVLYLKNLRKLRCLHITGARMVCIDSILNFISDISPHIEELNLSYSCFGDEHCSALVDALPNLRIFELWRTRVSKTRLVNLVMQLKSLEEFDTDEVFCDDDMKNLRGHPSLKNVRCRWIGEVETGFHVKSALQTLPSQYLRVDEEGPRSGLFYYWLQDHSNQIHIPLPKSATYLYRNVSTYRNLSATFPDRNFSGHRSVTFRNLPYRDLSN